MSKNKAIRDDNMNTISATEENLRTEMDVHPFDEDIPKKLELTMHPVLVDGIKGVATTGNLGTYSDRIVLSLEVELPDLGKEFGTKYFIFKEPGLVMWGHEKKTFAIQKIV